MARKDVSIFGRKVFFIVPEHELFPDDYIELFLDRGFEAYVIENDTVCPLKQKVECIIQEYPDSALFFNVDSQIDGIDWRDYIRQLRSVHSEDMRIGVLYRKRNKNQEESALEDYYVKQLGVRAGCISLKPNHPEDFENIVKALENVGAKGRRQFIRAECDSKSRADFIIDGKTYSVSVQDVNISHFSCIYTENFPKLSIYQKIRKVKTVINGMSIDTDVVLLIQRKKNNEHRGVFMFIKEDDTPELPVEKRRGLCRVIYRAISEKTIDRLRQIFKAAK